MNLNPNKSQCADERVFGGLFYACHIPCIEKKAGVNFHFAPYIESTEIQTLHKGSREVKKILAQLLDSLIFVVFGALLESEHMHK